METMSGDFIFNWIQFQILVNNLFFCELLSDFFIHGFVQSLKDHSRTKVEFVCQILSNLCFYILVTSDVQINVNHYGNIQKLYELVIFLRLLKFFDLLYELKTLRVIIETVRNLMGPLSDVGGMLFVIFYFFS
jgi:hypothetical protein